MVVAHEHDLLVEGLEAQRTLALLPRLFEALVKSDNSAVLTPGLRAPRPVFLGGVDLGLEACQICFAEVELNA